MLKEKDWQEEKYALTMTKAVTDYDRELSEEYNFFSREVDCQTQRASEQQGCQHNTGMSLRLFH